MNLYYGVTVNAAFGIASQVSSHINQFVTNFQTAFNPQLVKLYAMGETERFNKLVFQSSRFSYYLLFVISLPVLLTIDTILDIWLTSVPKYTAEFCQWILVFTLICAVNAPLWLAIAATGKIRSYQLQMFSVSITNLPLAWLCLAIGLSPVSILIVRCVMLIVENMVRLMYMRRNMSFPCLAFITKTIIPIVSVTALSVVFPLMASKTIDGYWTNLLIVVIVSIASSVSVVYFIGMTKSERSMVVEFVNKKIRKKNI